MDFTFSADQLALRDSVSRFLMTEAAPELLRELWETEGADWAQLHRRIATQGLTGLSVPESHGGLGLGDVDWVPMAQELGYFAIPDSVVDSAWVAAAALAALHDGHALRDAWLPRIAEGSARIALAHPANALVADAAGADLLLAVCVSAAGVELHAVERGAFSARPEASLEPSRRLAAVDFTPSPSSCVLAGPAAAALADALFDRAALAVAGQQVGLAQRMLDLAVDYAAQRKQFGRPIGSFQAVKHHLADVATKIEFARPVLYRAALALANGEPLRALFVSHARLACGDAAWSAGRKAIQVHGAMGYTWEVDLQMYMKRAWALDAAWGDRGTHKARLAAALLHGDTPLGPAALFG